MKNNSKIGLLTSNLNSGNMGCNALSYSAIRLLEEVAAQLGKRFEYVLFTYDDKGCITLYPEFLENKVEFVHPVVGWKSFLKSILKRRWKARRSFVEALENCSFVFEIAGGDSFSDIYGLKRPKFYNKIHRSLNKANIPLIFLPQTIGPFYSDKAKKSATSSLNIAKKVFVRDPLSLEEAKKYADESKLISSIDMAFFMSYTPSSKKNEKPRIGVNPSGLLWNGGYTGKNQFGLKEDYPTLIRSILSSIDPDTYEVVLVAHVLSGPGYKVEDDYKICKQLNSEFPHCEIAPFFYAPIEAKSFISGLDLLIASRMHACIAAYSSGVPVFPLAYSRKFKGLFQDELKYQYGADLSEDSITDTVSGIYAAMERIDGIKRELKDGHPKLAVYKLQLLDELEGILKASKSQDS